MTTGGHQTEGNNRNCDWWDWEHRPGKDSTPAASDRAADQWNRFPEDAALLSELGVNACRVTVEWSRVEPRSGEWDAAALRHYREEILLLLGRKITPVINLHLLTFPRWVSGKGRWEWKELPEHFAAYARKIYQEVAPEARYWIPLNEPTREIGGSYLEGRWPPEEHRDYAGLIPVMRGMFLTYAAAYHALKEEARRRGAEILVGMSHGIRHFAPATSWDPMDNLAAGAADGLWNWCTMHALETGVFEVKIPLKFSHEETIPGLKGTQDFIGLNYYTAHTANFTYTSLGLAYEFREELPKSDIGWDIYPEGLYEILLGCASRFPGRPILVTENGLPDAADSRRPAFLRDHLVAVSRARKEGVKVAGYFHRSSTAALF